MNRSKLYPHLVPGSVLDSATLDVNGFTLPIGHEIYGVVVEDAGGATRYLTPEEMRAEALDPLTAHQIAIENLIQLCRSEEFTPQLMRTASGRPFIIWHSHWLAAACIRLPYLLKLAQRHLNTFDVLASIPHEAAMLLFPRGDAKAQEEMRQLIVENEGDARKPLTLEWFALTPDGISEFREPQ